MAKEGEELNVKIIEFNKDTQRIVASHLRTWKDGAKDTEEESVAEYVSKTNNDDVADTLGDMSALANMKIEMDKANKDSE